MRPASTRPQKGIRPRDIKPAEAALQRLVEVLKVQNRRGYQIASRSGAGAAGGLGFGLSLFFGGRLEFGFELFANEVDLERHILYASLVITGEGAIDETTLSMGKGVGGVARLCRRLKRPCLGPRRRGVGSRSGRLELHRRSCCCAGLGVAGGIPSRRDPVVDRTGPARGGRVGKMRCGTDAPDSAG